MSDENEPKELLSILAPYLAMTALATLLLVFLVLRFLPIQGIASPSVVTFDVVKYANAQRAVASAFLNKSNDPGAVNELLIDLPRRTREAINEAAGTNTLVLLKQSVVQGQTKDITDEVLTALGLPTNVPTADAPSAVLDLAPTSTLLIRPAPRAESSNPTAAGTSGAVLP